MNINRKFLYVALIVVGLALVVGPVFGLWMRSEAVKYKHLTAEQEQEIAKLKASVGEMKAVLLEREQIIAEQQLRVAELGKARRGLQKQNESLLLDMRETEKQSQELLAGKNQLSDQLELVSAEQEQEIAKLKASVGEMKAVLLEREQIIAEQQLRVAELGKARRGLQKQNESLLLDMRETEKQSQELLAGKNQLSDQLELVSAEQEQEIAKLKASVGEMKAVLLEREQIIAEQQLRVAELGKARRGLQRQNESLLLDMRETEKQSQELLAGKNQLSDQLELVSAEARELARAKSQLSGKLQRISAEAEELAKAKRDREQALRDRQQLIESLKKEIDAGQVKIARLAGLTTVHLEDKILFDSSRATIKDSGFGVLKKVVEALRQIKDKHIQVQGHTDSRPIRWDLQRKYPTNWELSTARAATIVRYLVDEVGIDPTRLSASGYAFHQPIAGNDTPEGQQENRRVEFSILPARAATVAGGNLGTQ